MAIEPGAVATELTDHITRPDVKQAAEQMYNRWPAAGPLGATAGTAGVLVRDRIPVVTSLAFLTRATSPRTTPCPGFEDTPAGHELALSLYPTMSSEILGRATPL